MVRWVKVCCLRTGKLLWDLLCVEYIYAALMNLALIYVTWSFWPDVQDPLWEYAVETGVQLCSTMCVILALLFYHRSQVKEQESIATIKHELIVAERVLQRWSHRNHKSLLQFTQLRQSLDFLLGDVQDDGVGMTSLTNISRVIRVLETGKGPDVDRNPKEAVKEMSEGDNHTECPSNKHEFMVSVHVGYSKQETNGSNTGSETKKVNYKIPERNDTVITLQGHLPSKKADTTNIPVFYNVYAPERAESEMEIKLATEEAVTTISVSRTPNEKTAQTDAKEDVKIGAYAANGRQSDYTGISKAATEETNKKGISLNEQKGNEYVNSDVSTEIKKEIRTSGDVFPSSGQDNISEVCSRIKAKIYADEQMSVNKDMAKTETAVSSSADVAGGGRGDSLINESVQKSEQMKSYNENKEESRGKELLAKSEEKNVCLTKKTANDPAELNHSRDSSTVEREMDGIIAELESEVRPTALTPSVTSQDRDRPQLNKRPPGQNMGDHANVGGTRKRVVLAKQREETGRGKPGDKGEEKRRQESTAEAKATEERARPRTVRRGCCRSDLDQEIKETEEMKKREKEMLENMLSRNNLRKFPFTSTSWPQ